MPGSFHSASDRDGWKPSDMTPQKRIGTSGHCSSTQSVGPDQATRLSTAVVDHPTTVTTKKIILQTAGIWAATRVGYVVVTFFTVTMVANLPSGHQNGWPGAAMLNAWKQWDAGRYLSIIQHGYADPNNTAFFPLYPLLSSGVAHLLGQNNALLAALFVANVAALVAMIGIALLAQCEFGLQDSGQRALMALLAYPLSFFLVAPYSESLFLATSVFACYYARRGAWGRTALCALLAGLTRPTGVVLIPTLFWEFGRQQGWWWRIGDLTSRWYRNGAGVPVGQPPVQHVQSPGGPYSSAMRRLFVLSRMALVVVAVPASIGSYAAYLGVTKGDPLLFLHVEYSHWQRGNLSPIQVMDAVVRQILAPSYVDHGQVVTVVGSYWRGLQALDFGMCALILFATFLMVCTRPGGRRFPGMYVIYTSGICLLTFAAAVPSRPDVFSSIARYLLAAFPIYLYVSQVTRRRPWLQTLLLDTGFVLLGVFTAFWLTGHWVE